MNLIRGIDKFLRIGTVVFYSSLNILRSTLIVFTINLSILLNWFTPTYSLILLGPINAFC